MPTMIEKVARAVDSKLWQGHDILKENDPAYYAMDTPRAERQHSLDQARVAIEAMREPTPKMIISGNRSCTDGRGADESWPAMIEAALAEK